MCGIAGIVVYRPFAPPADRSELVATREAMAKRGPDGAGIWQSSDGKCGLAHRRLAIIDLSPSGAQPMASADGRYHVTFNGEIYNFAQLRAELEARSFRFRSTSDTEVLLHLYADRRSAMVHDLRGMYAFAIWDELEKRLFMARDPFGIKPLYYADDGATVRFASQVKALAAGGGIHCTPEPAGHVGFFVLGSVPEPFTMYREVHALPAGHTLTVERERGAKLECFFAVGAEIAAHPHRGNAMTQAERAEFIREALHDSVRNHMVADVPVGVFLSSGLDSSSVAALACEVTGGNVNTLTLGFEEYRGSANDEVPLALKTAAALGTAHHTRWLDRAEFEEEYERLLTAMDQPSIDGVNTYFVSKAAAERGMKVALSGLGGDELFAGYPSFHHVPAIARAFAAGRLLPGLGRLLRRLSTPLFNGRVSPKFAGLLEYGGDYAGAYLLRRALYMPWELDRFMDPAFFEEGWHRLALLQRMRRSMAGIESPRQRVSALELSWYMRNQLLRDSDWAGMAHSVEIRVPLLDVTLFRRLLPLLASRDAPSKLDVARSIGEPIRGELLQRRKTGFSIPVHEWARKAAPAGGPFRHLRNWAQTVHRPYKKLRALAFLSDSYGGHGGIALYNRDFIAALCAMEQMGEVVALPRIISRPLESLPPKLRYVTEAANSKLGFLRTTATLLRRDTRFDLVFCCHVNLLPAAYLAKRRVHAPLLTFIHGIDAWSPLPTFKSALLKHVDRFISVSDVTRRRFSEWSRVEHDRITILPNAIHTDWYGPGARSDELLERYGLRGKTILMTLGRLVSSERSKGFDEVLEAMPSLLREMPDLAYVIVGEGSDRGRLEQKVAHLGLEGHVRFAGMIPEAEKADHYRLADAYVMPSRGEGFGFVFLEAMACGVPVVASKVDGGREAVREGMLGTLVDPDDLEDVKRGIREALQRGRGAPPAGLEFFKFANFTSRSHELVEQTLHEPRGSGQVA